MTDAEPLLRMIWDAPFDDGPRLVYADWLEEQGDAARAEIIRVQIELSRLYESDLRGLVLKRREEKLLRLTQDWMRRLPQCRTSGVWRGQLIKSPFERGFPLPILQIPAATFLSQADEFLGAAPLWRIRFTQLTGLGRELAASISLARVKEIGASNCNLGDDDAMHLVQSPHLIHLTRLDLRFNELGTPTATALANYSSLPRLVRLDLRWNRLDQGSARLVVDRFGDSANVDPQQ